MDAVFWYKSAGLKCICPYHVALLRFPLSVFAARPKPLDEVFHECTGVLTIPALLAMTVWNCPSATFIMVISL